MLIVSYMRIQIPLALSRSGYIPGYLLIPISPFPPVPPTDNMHPIPTCVFFLLLFSSLVAATNFTDCLINFKNNINNTSGGVDSNGHQTSNLTAVVGLTYETCTAQCGKTAESFDWREFAQLFASWLLPWLALVSQLPFGSGNYEDDFISG